MILSPDDLCEIPHVEFRNVEKLKGEKILGISTDSRTVAEGDLFIALRGENFDGHRFLGDAFARGAVAAIVEIGSWIDPVETMPLLFVKDSAKALGDLARWYRSGFSLPVLAVGGSNGKTTTKDMIAAVLSTRYRVLATKGNLNNHIGVPQTLFRLEKQHQVAVVEIGTNHPGEIEYLCGILEPTHGIITNVGKEHLEYFRTLRGVAKEEGALFDALKSRKGSVAFVNADDRYVSEKAARLRGKVTYSLKTKRASVYGELLGMDDQGYVTLGFAAKSNKRATTVTLKVPGLHNAMNALAAAAVGLTFKVSAQKIKKALEGFTATSKRMETLDINGIVVYNDTYNANPDSMIAALRTLAAAKVPGKKIAVLADMKELGETSVQEHTRVGKEVGALGLEYLLTFGDHAKILNDAARCGFKVHYEQKNMLAEYLAELVIPGDAVLIKGSRSMQMEDVVAFLQERFKSRPLG